MRRSFIQHLHDGSEHSRHRPERLIGQLAPAKTVEMAKELVRAVDEVNDHCRAMLRSAACRSGGLPFDVFTKGQITCSLSIKGAADMRFMMIVKASKESEAGEMPKEKVL